MPCPSVAVLFQFSQESKVKATHRFKALSRRDGEEARTPRTWRAVIRFLSASLSASRRERRRFFLLGKEKPHCHMGPCCGLGGGGGGMYGNVW